MKTEQSSRWSQVIAPSLSLFTSIGTLVCCALPALLVSIGMGATLAGLVSTAPWITVISEYKTLVFTIAGILITLAVSLQWRSRHYPCPDDPAQAKACARLRKISWWILGLAVVLYIIGFFFAFLAVYVFY